MLYRLLLISLTILALPAIAQRRDTVSLKTATGNIYGTLTIPKQVKTLVPVVIIIPGSGPTDRDGNNGPLQNNSLRMLSDSLSRRGIASLRYDKRGIGASKAAAPDESSLRFPDYVEDVTGWIGQLKKDKRFGKILVAGHSEGSLIGMLAVKKVPVAGFISIAGAGKSADKIVIDQLTAMPQLPRTTLDSMITLFGQLRRDGHISNLPDGPWFKSLFRPSVQPYFASWLQYDPAKEIEGVNIPTLIIQGLSDLQVDSNQSKLLAAGKPDAQLLLIPGMNHVFKNAPADDRMANMATYYDSSPIMSALPKAIASFIKSL